MKNESYNSKILRQEDAANFIDSIDDVITKRLLITATHFIITKFIENPNMPIIDIDMKFFTESLLKFCSNHELLRDILDGKDISLFSDE